MRFFAIVGWLGLMAITWGPAAFILFQGWVMSKFGGRYPAGALVAAGIFVALGVVVIRHAPFHIQLTP